MADDDDDDDDGAAATAVDLTNVRRWRATLLVEDDVGTAWAGAADAAGFVLDTVRVSGAADRLMPRLVIVAFDEGPATAIDLDPAALASVFAA